MPRRGYGCGQRRVGGRDAVVLCLTVAFGLGLHLSIYANDRPRHREHAFPEPFRPRAPREAPAPAAFEGPSLYASLVETERAIVEQTLSVERAVVAEVVEEARSIVGAPAAGAGPMEAWAAARLFPVVLLACDRESLLRDALTSLVAGCGAEPEDILVVRDGDDAAVERVVREFRGVRFASRARNPRKVLDGAARIAGHYEFALKKAMEAFADAPAVVVAEDDLVFSPDFLAYFSAVGPIVERDASVFVVSAWNDNGFADADAADPAALRRSAWFPGLGWLLPRALWETELRDRWPSTHWDHWMREPRNHRGRECVYPEIPRSFHAGSKGTFMDPWHDARYFRRIVHRTAPYRWPRRAYAPVMTDAYELRIRKQLASAEHVGDLAALKARAAAADDARPLALWYHWPPAQKFRDNPPPFLCLSEVLGIWHEHQRAAHSGLHEHHLGRRKVFLINVRESDDYRTFKPVGLAPLTQDGCPRLSWKDIGK